MIVDATGVKRKKLHSDGVAERPQRNNRPQDGERLPAQQGIEHTQDSCRQQNRRTHLPICDGPEKRTGRNRIRDDSPEEVQHGDDVLDLEPLMMSLLYHGNLVLTSSIAASPTDEGNMLLMLGTGRTCYRLHVGR